MLKFCEQNIIRMEMFLMPRARITCRMLGEAFLKVGLHLLKEGIVWRVGNGESINIWTDPKLVHDE